MIRPFFKPDFLLATTVVHKKKDLSEPEVYVPQGYTLLLRGEHENGWRFVASAESAELTCNCEKELDALGRKDPFVTLAWVKRSFEVTFPIGVAPCGDEPGRWTKITVEVDVEALMTSSANLPWRRQRFGEWWFNVLAEYFVDEEDKQSGLSILFRNKVLLCLEQDFNGIFDKKNLLAAARKALASLAWKGDVVKEGAIKVGEIRTNEKRGAGK